MKIELPPEKPKTPLKINVEKYMSKRKSQYNIPDYINPEIAYLAGALRDGSISKTETPIGTKYYIAFCNSSYEWLQNTIKPILEKLFQIEIKEPVEDRKSTKYQIRVRKHGIVLFLSDLFEHPFGKQTGWKTPNWIMNAPEEIKKWYVRGFFDSEGGCGNVAKQKEKYPWQSVFYIGFYGSSKEEKCEVLEDLKNILKDFEVNSKPIRQDNFERRNSYETKSNAFFFKITHFEDKTRFIERIGSSHPEKLNNLITLSKMIAAQS